MPIITDEDRKTYQKSLEERREAETRQEQEEINVFMNGGVIKSIVDDVVKEVKWYYANTGHYPRRVSIQCTTVTQAVVKDGNCQKVLDIALRDLNDDHYEAVELRAPRQTWGTDVSPRDAQAANETVFVYFTGEGVYV